VTPTPDLLEQLAAVGVTTILTSSWMAAGVNKPDGPGQAEELIGAYAERFIT
jgi:hypothetical protein